MRVDRNASDNRRQREAFQRLGFISGPGLIEDNDNNSLSVDLYQPGGLTFVGSGNDAQLSIDLRDAPDYPGLEIVASGLGALVQCPLFIDENGIGVTLCSSSALEIDEDDCCLKVKIDPNGGLAIGAGGLGIKGAVGTEIAEDDNQSANKILSGPSSGGAAPPTFRTLVAADIPDISATYATASHTHGIADLPDKRAYKASDESVSNTTLQDDDALTVSLAASAKYAVRVLAFVAAAGALEGFKAALDGTVGVTSMKAEITIYDDVANTMVALARVTSKASAVGAGLSLGDSFCTIEGTIETSTAGTLLLSWAQNGGAGASSTTVQRGSYMEATRLA